MLGGQSLKVLAMTFVSPPRPIERVFITLSDSLSFATLSPQERHLLGSAPPLYTLPFLFIVWNTVARYPEVYGLVNEHGREFQACGV